MARITSSFRTVRDRYNQIPHGFLHRGPPGFNIWLRSLQAPGVASGVMSGVPLGIGHPIGTRLSEGSSGNTQDATFGVAVGLGQPIDIRLSEGSGGIQGA